MSAAETTSRSGGKAGPPLVRASGLQKVYRRGPEEVRALAGASFVLRLGEVVALSGPSGSGKTTLLNVICGWERPDEGEVEWEGEPDSAPANRRWADLAIVPQDLGLLEELSVHENVELPARLAGLRGDEWRSRIDELLEGMGLERYANRRPGELSLGEQQRLAVARALVLGPKLVLADEPTGHQDAGWAEAVYRAFQDAASRGTSCLVATHSREFLRSVDRVLSIRDGRVDEVERDGGEGR